MWFRKQPSVTNNKLPVYISNGPGEWWVFETVEELAEAFCALSAAFSAIQRVHSYGDNPLDEKGTESCTRFGAIIRKRRRFCRCEEGGARKCPIHKDRRLTIKYGGGENR